MEAMAAADTPGLLQKPLLPCAGPLLLHPAWHVASPFFLSSAPWPCGVLRAQCAHRPLHGPPSRPFCVRSAILQASTLRLREGKNLSLAIPSTISFLPPFPARRLFPELSWLFLCPVFLFSFTFSCRLFYFSWYFLFSLCCVQVTCGCVSTSRQ